MIKYLNNLIKLLKKNLYLSLFVIFLLIFGFFQLSIGNFTSSDFTLINTDLVGNNIQLSNFTVYDTQWNLNSQKLLNLHPLFVNPNYQPGAYFHLSSNGDVFCSAYGKTFLSFKDSLSYINSNYHLYSVDNSWISGGTALTYKTIICQSSDLNTLGSIVQTIPTITISSYDTLSLKYNYTLNGGTLTPILIVNGVEKSLINNELKGTFSVGTNVSVKFIFSGSLSSTPQINNNLITLVGSNVGNNNNNNNNNNNLTLSQSVNSQIISTLKTTSQSLSSPKTSVNKIASYFGDLVFNFFKLLLSPFGF